MNKQTQKSYQKRKQTNEQAGEQTNRQTRPNQQNLPDQILSYPGHFEEIEYQVLTSLRSQYQPQFGCNHI